MGVWQSKKKMKNSSFQGSGLDASAALRNPSQNTILLLYGTGESGKTTILRQMKLIHGSGLETDRTQYRGIICYNILEGAALTIRAGQQRYNLPFEDADSQYVLDRAQKASSQDPTQFNLDDTELANAIINLYKKNEDFKTVLGKSNEYQINDGWDGLMQRMVNEYPKWGTSASGWTPSVQDLLFARIRTTGRQIVKFQEDGLEYHMVDVGGQRQERKKFYHLFSKAKCVVYVVSLSEYDEVLFEDDVTNRLIESLTEWKNCVNSPPFENTFVLLIFNKFDLFQKKYYQQKRPIQVPGMSVPPIPLAEDEDGPGCEKALAWYEDIFLRLVESPERRKRIRPYTMTALDRDKVDETIKFGINALRHMRTS